MPNQRNKVNLPRRGSRPIVDARQIIKQRRAAGSISKRNVRNNQPSNRFFKNQFKQVFVQNQNTQRRNFNNRSFVNSSKNAQRRNVSNQPLAQPQNTQRRNFNNRSFENSSSGKSVQMGRGGLLRITSRVPNEDTNDEVVPKSRRIVSDLPGITVVTRNRLTENKQQDDMMEEDDDDLENMKLEDLPGVDHMTSLPRGLDHITSLPRGLDHITSLPRGLDHITSLPRGLDHITSLPRGLDHITSLPRGLISTRKAISSGATSISSAQASLFERLYSGSSTMVADRIAPQTSSTPMSWSVLVTNLHPAVTEDDIIELFSSVAPMKSAQMVEPGIAIVEYYTKDHANKACDRYHSLLLDGQPMQCVLKTEEPARTPISLRLGEKRNFVPSVRVPRQTASSVFLQKPYIANTSVGRNVEFTVKLP